MRARTGIREGESSGRAADRDGLVQFAQPGHRIRVDVVDEVATQRVARGIREGPGNADGTAERLWPKCRHLNGERLLARLRRRGHLVRELMISYHDWPRRLRRLSHDSA